MRRSESWPHVISEYMSLETGRGELAVRCTGSGPAATVCLHPLASSGEFWDPLARYLGRYRRVVSPDLRGHGRTSWDRADFSLEEMADDVAVAVTVLGLGPVSLVGMSMGGCVALALTLRHPELVSSLVLVDTTSNYGPDREEKWTLRAQRALEVERTAQLTFQYERWFTEEFVRDHPVEAGRVADIFLRTDSAAHAAACRALGAFDVTDSLSQIETSTLIVVGENDLATPPAMSKVLVDAIPDSRMILLPQVKHMSIVESDSAWGIIAQHAGAVPAEESRS